MEGQSCMDGSDDYEKCGNGLICNKSGHKYYDSGVKSNTCDNPCRQPWNTSTRAAAPDGFGSDNKYYQNNPNRTEYDKCIKGVGASTQNSTSTSTGTTTGTGQGKNNIEKSQGINQRQGLINRFCLCVVDVGCVAPVVKPKADLVFNFMWIVGNIARSDDTRDWYEFGRDAKCKGGTQLIDRPRITASTPWAKREDNDQICVEGQCCKDGPGPSRSPWDCGTEQKAGWVAADPADTSRKAQMGFYSGQGDDLYSCQYWFDAANGGGGIKNGAVATMGANTKGCEHFEFYCGIAIPCWRDRMFTSEVKEAFDISSKNFGGYTAFKVEVSIPPKGETREVFLHYHLGTRGAGGSKARMWVHEMTKDQRDYATVNSSMTGNPRQSGAYKWDFAWDLCSNTTGGPNPTNPEFDGDKQATIGVLTVLPDGTWTVAAAK